jgi:hypothetical protein
VTVLALGCTVLGATILALVSLDIWATVLHPGVESPLSNRFHRAGWRLLRLVTRRVPRHNALLHAGLPLLVAGLITLWLVLLLVGYAVLYYPWLSNPALFTIPRGTTHWELAALYASGATLFTLGYGDITPVAWPLRTLAVAEAGSGMATISLAVAYVLAVYPALTRLRACATALDAEVAGQVGGLPLLRRYLLGDGHWNSDLDNRLRELALELLALTESHETHPVLYYAHPPRVQQSALRMLVTVQNLIGLLRYGLSPERHADLVRNPQVLFLEQVFGYSLRRLSTSLHSSPIPPGDEKAMRRRYGEDFAHLCDELEGLGLVSARQRADRPVPVLAQAGRHPDLADPGSDGDAFAARPIAKAEQSDARDPALDLASESPAAAYIAYRLATDLHIAAYAAASGYTLEEATGTDDSVWAIGDRR